MDTKEASVTVSVAALLEMLPATAMIVALPTLAELATPFEPGELLTVATPESEELQITWSVRSCAEPSVKMPVASRCSEVPFATLELTGVNSMDASVAAVTVSVVLPLVVPQAFACAHVAVIRAVPGVTEVT